MSHRLGLRRAQNLKGNILILITALFCRASFVYVHVCVCVCIREIKSHNRDDIEEVTRSAGKRESE